jgi:Zn-dependent membrane protease YugP
MYPFLFPWDILIFAAFGLSLWASFHVKSTFRRWSQVPIQTRMTGSEAARCMLDSNGLYDVPVEAIAGQLTDHYDPAARAVRLSESVYGNNSIAAVSVACHEVGHAIQHSSHYPALVMRHRMFPLVNFTSGISPYLIIAGFLLAMSNLILIGIVLFSAAVAFQLVTLPVEFNASTRARKQMVTHGFINEEESTGAGKVLNAAALTYVAAALVSLLQLLKFVMIFLNNRR